jgi:tetratricopeptide (TPR) repeat protein
MANLDKYKDAARKYELKEQWPKAIEVLVKGIEEYEKSPDNEADLALYNRVGDLYSKLSDSTNAIQYYERAVDMYQEAGMVNPAIAVCNKVLRLSPGRASTYLKLGMLFAKKGFAAEAKQNLLEYADRMQKAGQIEEAFKALKKFAEMTPGQQDEIWAVLSVQARAQAKTPEAKEQVEKLLSEFDAKDKAASHRKSRASRSMVTGEEIPPETGPKKGELIFLDIGEVVTPGRRSGAMRTGGMAAIPLPPPPAPPPPAPPPPAPPPRPAPPPPPPPPVPEPVQELEPIELETTSLADDLEPASPPVDLPMLDVDAPAGARPEQPMEIESTGLGLEPTAFEPEPRTPTLGFERTSQGVDAGSLGVDAMSLDLEPTAFEPPPAAPGLAPSTDFDSGNIQFDAPDSALEPAAEPSVDLPMLDMGEETPAAAPVQDLPMLDTEPEPEPATASAELAAAESEAAQNLEFLDLGGIEAPAAPSLDDLAALVRANVEDWEGRRRYGEALIEHGERERGLAELDASLAGYDQADDINSAMSLTEEVLRLEPNSVRHQQKRVELAYRSGDRSRLVDAYVELADALLRSNEPDKSVAVYQRVLEHDPDNLRAKSAIETLAPPAPPPAAGPPRVSSRPSKPAPQAPAGAAGGGKYMDLGAFLLDEEPAKDTRMRIEDEEPTGDEQKDFAQMLQAFKKGIDANVAEEDFQSHYDLGVAYKEMGLLDEAIAEFQKALRAPDGKLKGSEALGLCFFEKGQFAVAETILRRGLDVPAHGDAERVGLLYWMGRSQEELGKDKDALEAYNRVFGVDINFQDVNQRVQALAKGRK